jgi:site-specific recombinase XerD
MRGVAKRSQFKKRVFPQLMRHSLAVNMLMRGAGIYTIREQLRHAFVETTLGYVNAILYTPKGEYEKFVPSYL